MPGPRRIDAPNELTSEQKAIARACSDPGQWVRRYYWPDGYGGEEYEPLHVWQARAVDTMLKLKGSRTRAGAVDHKPVHGGYVGGFDA